MKWSEHQNGIFAWASISRNPSAAVKAVAGSGKTTTMMEAVARSGVPSTVVAFNRSIADELKRRARYGNLVGTFHSLCLRALNASGLRLEVHQDKLRRIGKALGAEFNLPFASRSDTVRATVRLVGVAKNLGVGLCTPDRPAVWADIAERFELDDSHDTMVFARALLERSVKDDTEIDFDDMLYYALGRRARFPRAPFLGVDEVQDLNPIQRALLPGMLSAGGRLMAVGDPAQAIYAFRGADAFSFDRVKEDFDCIELPLTICYRCSRSVALYAQELVPYLEPWSEAPLGEVLEEFRPTWADLVPDQDVVLCRNNAPLFRMALSMLRAGIGCRIVGRDLEADLVRIIDQSKAETLVEFESSLAAWRDFEIARHIAADREELAAGVEDRYACLVNLMDSLAASERTIAGLKAKLTTLFSEGEGLLELSTIHKAKGREWENVFMLRPDLLRPDWLKAKAKREREEGGLSQATVVSMGQDRNLDYVGRTRAKFGYYLVDQGIERV